MKLCSVYDEAFSAYGRVAGGVPVEALLNAVKKRPMGAEPAYFPREETLHAVTEFESWGEAFFGGLPYELGYCTAVRAGSVEALVWHQGSGLYAGAQDFILPLALRADMKDGVVPADKVRLFRAPAGVALEVYGPTLRGAPQPCGGETRVLICLPYATNTEFTPAIRANAVDERLIARNTWKAALDRPVAVG